MSIHVAVVMETKQVSDQEIAVRLRCCSDPTTDSWHTIKVLKDTTPTNVQAWTADRTAHVQDCHAAVVTAQALFATMTATQLK